MKEGQYNSNVSDQCLGESTGQPFFLNLFRHLCIACKGICEVVTLLSAPHQMPPRERSTPGHHGVVEHLDCKPLCVAQLMALWSFRSSRSDFGLQGSFSTKGTAGHCCCCCFETGWLVTSYDKTWVCSVLKTHRTS